MTASELDAIRGEDRGLDGWSRLRPWTHPIDASDQVIVIAGTGGAKSTLVATMTLDVASLVAIDEKGSLELPDARIVELPRFDDDNPDGYDAALRSALAWRHKDGAAKRAGNRVILRPHELDIDDAGAHDRIFRAIFARGETLVWIDEVTATGATAQRVPPYLRALSARGRTRGLGLWTLSQSPFGLLPPIIRRNATYTILGSLDPADVADLHRPGVELAAAIPRKSGRFILYRAGEADPYRLFLPIPPQLRNWRAP